MYQVMGVVPSHLREPVHRGHGDVVDREGNGQETPTATQPVGKSCLVLHGDTSQDHLDAQSHESVPR